jgi:hypothetical protein
MFNYLKRLWKRCSSRKTFLFFYIFCLEHFLLNKNILLYLRCVHRDTCQFSCKMILVLPNFSKTQNSSMDNHTSKLPLSNFIKFIQHFSTCFISTDKRSYYNKNMHIVKEFVMILVNDQLDALFLNVFISCSYMFRETSAHHQEGQIVLIHHLV